MKHEMRIYSQSWFWMMKLVYEKHGVSFVLRSCELDPKNDNKENENEEQLKGVVLVNVHHIFAYLKLTLWTGKGIVVFCLRKKILAIETKNFLFYF